MRPHRGRLHIEPLEHRLMLSAAPWDGDASPSTEVGEVTDQTVTIADDDLSRFSRFDSAEELQQYLIADAVERYKDLFGQPGYYWWRGWPEYMLFDGGANVVAPTIGAPDHSDTNTQVEGVDEGDLVETDGDYLYVLSGRDLVIFDAWPAEELEVASRVGIEGQPFAQYLNGDRLTVLSNEYVDWGYIEPMPLLGGPMIMPRWDPYWAPSTLTATVFDVSDRTAPSVVQEVVFDGSLVDSRAIGTSIYFILRDDFILPPPELILVPAEGDGSDGADGSSDANFDPDIWPPLPGGKYIHETEEQYLQRIEGQVLDLALPSYRLRGPDGELGEPSLLSEATDVYQPFGADDTSLITVAVLDMAANDTDGLSSTSIPAGYTSEVYVSPGSLYLLQTSWWREETTSIMKFDMGQEGGSVDLVAMGVVPGRVLNQFSVDEYDGYLRIATTGGWAGQFPDQGGSRNNVYVLEQDGENLEIVGRLEGLAPGETIYSARFMGKQAFLVTYYKVDPLFVLDLSDPKNPEVTGKLKIPGFSNYLHAVDNEHLIGIGRNADPETGLYDDPQVSLFDVGAEGDPVLLDRFTIETGRVGGVNIFDDHHVIAYFPEHHVLAVSIPDRDDPGVNGYWAQNDLWVFKIDVDPAGERPRYIELLARIGHDTSVLRSVRIEDYLYSISETTISVHDILDPKPEVAALHYGITELGPIDFAEFPDLNLSDYDHWYRFETIHRGLLTLKAIASGSAEVDLYSRLGERLEPQPGERGGWEIDAEETYYFSVRDSGEDPGPPPAEENVATVTLAVDLTAATVAGRHVFYNGSAFDGDSGPNVRDDLAIAPDKAALLPGETATLTNYTSYSRGINGVIVDVADLHGVPTADDFVLKVGNDSDPSDWAAAPTPQSITVRPGAGVDGSDRMTLIWPDNATDKQWLQVTVLATEATGLETADVFYFGNAIGESGNSAADAMVGSADEILARNNVNVLASVAIDNRFDYDRDMLVSSADQIIARRNRTAFDALQLISVPAADALAESGHLEVSPNALVWLSGIEVSGAQDDSATEDGLLEEAVDLLLAGG